MSNTNPPCISVLRVNARHSDNDFIGFSCFLVPGIGKFVIELILDVTHCTCLYNPSRRLWKAEVISSMLSFCSSKAKCVSSLSFVPQIQWIMEWSLQHSCCSWTLFCSLRPTIGPPFTHDRTLSQDQWRHRRAVCLQQCNCPAAGEQQRWHEW